MPKRQTLRWSGNRQQIEPQRCPISLPGTVSLQVYSEPIAVSLLWHFTQTPSLPTMYEPLETLRTTIAAHSYDVFISYASEDQSTVVELVRILKDRAWEVWWDRAIGPGRDFEDEIDNRALIFGRQSDSRPAASAFVRP